MKVIGIGIDLVEIARIGASMARHGERFLARLFTDEERRYCESMRCPERCFAARFAAKEAVSKAFGTGIGAQLGWLDMEVRRLASGAPHLVLSGTGAETAERLGITEVKLSLSHSETAAVANAVALALP